MSAAETQTAFIARLLLTYGSVSAHDLTYLHGVTRAASRIWDLKRQGYDIKTVRGSVLPDGTREMATYRLLAAPQGVRPAIEELSLW